MDPQSMDVETAKRALTTEEESPPPVTKKSKVEEEDKEHDGDKEDDGDKEGDGDKKDDGDCGSDNDYIVWYHLRYKYVPEKEPEWDVDSYDGREYESDPEDRKQFADENEYNEFRAYKREMFDAKGFIPDIANGIHTFGDLDTPVGENRTYRDELTHLASLCVKKLNEDKGKSVELVSVVGATVSGGAKMKIYITFMAREYENGPIVEYQAKVMRYIGNYEPPFPILCRPSPKPTI